MLVCFPKSILLVSAVASPAQPATDENGPHARDQVANPPGTIRAYYQLDLSVGNYLMDVLR